MTGKEEDVERGKDDYTSSEQLKREKEVAI
jgi:hypothetical protein